MRDVAFLTDVEGRWDKLVDFCAGNPYVTLDDAGTLRVADGAVFVFGGDVCDRGPSSLRLVRSFLEAKRAQPDRIVWLAGNRDVNKLRLARELTGAPPSGAPSGGSRADLLRYLLAETMGARRAFEFRRAELGAAASDDEVVDSFLAEVAPDGPLTSYLASAALAHREGDTLFMHGGVTAENLGVVPGQPTRERRLDAWLRALDEFLAGSIEAFIAGQNPAALIDYQAPIPGTKLNQASVIYARPTDDRGDPWLPPAHVIAALRAAGVRRLVLGHTPSGDCPALLRDDDGFELLLADNSYGRIERGSRVIVSGGALSIEGVTSLDGGEEAAVRWSGAQGPLGRRDPATRRLIKAQLARGDFLGFRAQEGYQVEQVAIPADQLAGVTLVAPR